VRYFIVKRNFPEMEILTQSELSVLEKISDQIDTSVSIEHIENGNIIYLSESFPAERFNQLRDTFLQNVDLIDPALLPEEYGEWYDSIFGETLYFETTGDKYLQLIINIIRYFTGEDPQASDLIKRIFKRIVKSES